MLFSALTIACINKQVAIVELLLDHGADLNATNARGFPPLLCAAKVGSKEIADILLFHGADVEQTDRHGRTALMIAASEGHVGVMEMLLSKGLLAIIALLIQEKYLFLNGIRAFLMLICLPSVHPVSTFHLKAGFFSSFLVWDFLRKLTMHCKNMDLVKSS